MTPAAEALLLAGGTWHDFDAFAGVAAALASNAGLSVRRASDPNSLCELQLTQPQLVVLYTCIDGEAELRRYEAPTVALRAWVRGGGRLLALHSSTVAAAKSAELEALLGAAFVRHPPKQLLRVSTVGSAHPTTEGTRPFYVADELYHHRSEPQGDVHLVAEAAGSTHPAAWSRKEGNGSVYYLGLGHDADAWSHDAFQTLLTQTLLWLAR